MNIPLALMKICTKYLPPAYDLCVCVSVCVSVQAITFECLDLDHIYVKFEYQGHLVKVTFVKLTILSFGH